MLRARIEKLESARGGAALPVVLRVNPHGDAAHSAEVRQVGRMPNGYLIVRDDADLVTLLGPADPVTVKHRGPGIVIHRGYGYEPA